MILGHKLTVGEVGSLCESNELWKSLEKYLKAELNYDPADKYAKWTQEPNEENINRFWNQFETNDYNNNVFEIDCYFGSITVYRNTLRIWFSTIFYSYNFFQDVKATIQIINIGRVFAKYLGTDKVLYIPDGYIKTAIIENFACSNLTLNQAIKKGIEKFGEPPVGISKGRKNYFFVDYVDEEIGEIKEWHDEEDFWQWDEMERDYKQLKK